MTLGRTSAGKIKIKTDTPKGLRAVECGCCGAGCDFNGYIQELDGSYNKYKYLKLSINGTYWGSWLINCDVPPVNQGSYSLWFEIDRIINPDVFCLSRCLNAQGSYYTSSLFYGWNYERIYTVSNCVQAVEYYIDGNLESSYEEPFLQYSFSHWFIVSDFANNPDAVVTITSDTEAQVALIYSKTTGEWSGGCEGDCDPSSQDYIDGCGTCCGEETISNITLTYKLSNERIT